jgi:hypothetical protein
MRQLRPHTVEDSPEIDVDGEIEACGGLFRHWGKLMCRSSNIRGVVKAFQIA